MVIFIFRLVFLKIWEEVLKPTENQVKKCVKKWKNEKYIQLTCEISKSGERSVIVFCLLLSPNFFDVGVVGVGIFQK